ncbi:MAG: YgjV family protein [Desulforhopalus sp.]
MSNFVLSQILVGIAICTDILSFQLKERHKIVACLMVSALLISAHFMLLGHWTAAGLAILATVRFAISIFSTSKKIMALFMIATVAVAIFSYAGLLSILGCSATLFTTAASFCKNDKFLRQLMLVGTAIWIVHNALAGSPGAVILESLFISSNLVGYFRFYIKPKGQALHP